MERRWFWFGFLVPGAVWLAIFFLIPLVVVFGVSIGRVDELGRPYDLFGGTWDAWSRVLNDDTVLRPIIRSFAYAGAATIIAALLGFPVAYTIARYGGRFKGLLIVLVILPFWVNYLVRTYALLVILQDNGPVNEALGWFGLGPFQLINNAYAVVFGLAYSFLPFMVLPIFAAIERIDGRVLEAGRDLYGSPWATFWNVTFPLSRQGLLAGCVLTFLPGFGDFITADLLGGPSTFMLGNLIQLQFLGEGDLPYGAVLTFLMIPALLLLMLWYLRSASNAAREAQRA